MHALPIMVATLCILAIAYRFYTAFIAAKVLSLDDTRVTPAHRMSDGHNYVPTNRWVLFGHHFAAITGAGPLHRSGAGGAVRVPPGLIWILVGVVLGGAVHDFVTLTCSIRAARPVAGRDGARGDRRRRRRHHDRWRVIAIVHAPVIIALAARGPRPVNQRSSADSPVGRLHARPAPPDRARHGARMHTVRKRARRGIPRPPPCGVIALLARVCGRALVAGLLAGADATFSLTKHAISASAAYGFVASVLPVWMLLCPRDYLSSFLKLGTHRR